MTRFDFIKMLQEGTDDRCCGCCKRFKDEDSFGFGWCSQFDHECECGDVCPQFIEI